MSMHRRLHQALPAHQAAGNSPTLARLTELIKESNDRLKAIESLLPETLRQTIKAGPIDDKSWCLLQLGGHTRSVPDGNAAAAKTRQLIPLIQSRLSREGWKVTAIRLKILIAKK